MNRPLIALATLAAFLPVSLYAQSEFRAVGSGKWTDSRNWQIESGGIWLQPPDGVYPGESHHQNVDVIVSDGSTVTVTDGQNIHVGSLTIAEGRVDVKGVLVIGPTKDNPENTVTIIPSNGGIGIVSTTLNDAPPTSPSVPDPMGELQLLQNNPNPVSMSTGDWTAFNFFIDRDYSLVRLSIFDEMGVELQRIYEDYHPAIGWKNIKINTRTLQSGSYPTILQADNAVLRRSLTIIR
jgi:hypothetical protein